MLRYRYRVYPTLDQQQAISRLLGCVRVAFNDALALRKANYAQTGMHLSSKNVSAALTASKRTPERQWLNEVSAVPLQQALRDLDTAYKNFFSSVAGKRKGARMAPPRFRKKTSSGSARFTSNARFGVRQVNTSKALLTLPKIGELRVAYSRTLPAPPTSVTLIREADGRYYASFVVNPDPATTAAPTSTRAAGLDLGLTDFAAIVYSDGTREKIPAPTFYRKAARKLGRAQRELARRVKGSKNRAKSRIKVAKIHAMIRDDRQDFTRKIAVRLARENQTVAIETLNIKGLARTRLAKSIHDAGWGAFINDLTHAGQKCGATIIGISQWEPTSQVCSVCGTKNGKKALSIRAWECPECSTLLDRDYNAALNIMLAAGLAESLNDCGGNIRLQLAGAVPQETVTTRLVTAA
ncbi:RNA-guided endonuclease InsQ/TnpB family protein [Arthrobacter sp. TMN-49]